MTTTQPTSSATPEQSVPAIPMRFEVTTLPVADVDRAKAFCLGLGWHLDIDFKLDENTLAHRRPSSSAAAGRR